MPTPTLPVRVSLLHQLALRAEANEGIGVNLVEEPIDERIGEAIAQAEATLVPAGEHAASRVLEMSLEVLSARRPPAQAVKVYLRLLGELPADLLALAAKAALADTTYHKLPPPGVFLRAVRGQMNDRRELLGRLRRHAERLAVARLRRVNKGIF